MRQVVVDGERGIKDYAVLLRRRWKIVASVGLLGLLAAIGLTLLQPTVYRAESRVLLQHSTNDPLVAQPDSNEAQRRLNNEIMLIGSSGARDAVRAAYTGALDPDDVTANIVQSDADVIRISLDARDADEAAALVNTYVATYAEYRREVQVSELLGASSVLKTRVDEIKQQIDQLNAPITALDVRIAIETNATELERLRAERAGVVTQSSARLNDLQSQLSFYQQELDKVQLSSNLRASSALAVLQAAEVPDAPVSPQPVRNIALGLICGLLVGVAAAFAREQFDDVLRDREVVDAIAGVPGLGAIPRLPGSGGSVDELVTVRAPLSAPAEAFRSLRTSLKFVGINRSARVVQVTSASAGEGKTFVAANLAVAMANAGQRVLVAGCDLRRPRLDLVERTSAGPGLTEVLVGEATLEEAIWPSSDVENLAVLRTGSVPPNPTELLASDRARALFAELAESYDMVVVDCPPLLPVSDSLIVASYVDVSLLVVADGMTTREGLARAVELLRQGDAPLVGTILNGIALGEGYAYQYEVKQPNRRTKRRIVKKIERVPAPSVPAALPQPEALPSETDEFLEEVVEVDELAGDGPVADDPWNDAPGQDDLDLDRSELDEALKKFGAEMERSSADRREGAASDYDGAERRKSFTVRKSGDV